MIFTATIAPQSRRYNDWLAAVGTDTVRIHGFDDWPGFPKITLGCAPGVERAFFYHLDVGALSAEQRAGVVQMLARNFGEDPAEVEELIDDPEQGVPILVDEVIVVNRDEEDESFRFIEEAGYAG